MDKKIDIYCKKGCPFCKKALKILEEEYSDYKINVYTSSVDFENKYFKKRYNNHTYPLIFIDDKKIGGCDDLEHHVYYQ